MADRARDAGMLRLSSHIGFLILRESHFSVWKGFYIHLLVIQWVSHREAQSNETRQGRKGEFRSI